MSREIKFRAWDKRNKIMLDNSLKGNNNYSNYLLIKAIDGTLWNKKDFNSEEYAINLVLMQYTGLKDKNGKEIYEGDIVSCGKHVSGFSPMPQVVEYKTYEFDNETIAGFSPFCRTKYIAKDSEIIGNVFENSDIVSILVQEYSNGFQFNGIDFNNVGKLFNTRYLQ